MTATHTTGAPLVSDHESLARPSTDAKTHDNVRLQRDLRDHVLLNFTNMGRFADADVPVFVRGDGCHVIDANGRRFIDGLSGLFCTNLGHSYGAELGTPEPFSFQRTAVSGRMYFQETTRRGWHPEHMSTALLTLSVVRLRITAFFTIG